MRQSELRKGNYVLNHEGKVVKIDSIFIDEQPYGLFPVVKHSGYIHTDVGFLKPVEINEEWLIRLGFSQKEEWPSGGGHSMVHCTGYRVEVRHGEYIFTPSKMNKEGYFVKYVHEIQNLYNEILEREYNETE